MKEVFKFIVGDVRNFVFLIEKLVLNENKLLIVRIFWDWWKERKDGVVIE